MKSLQIIIQFILVVVLVLNTIAYQVFVWFPTTRPEHIDAQTALLLAAVHAVGLTLLITRKDCSG